MLGLAFLGQMFGGLLGWLSQTLIKRIAIIAAFTVIVAGLVATLVTIVNVQISLLGGHDTLPDWLRPALVVLPANTITCIGVIATAEAALWIYRMSYKMAAIRVGAV